MESQPEEVGALWACLTSKEGCEQLCCMSNGKRFLSHNNMIIVDEASMH